MYYISTRGKADKVSSAMAIKNGLASDGGLYMPESIPQLSTEEIKELLGMDYPHRAHKVIKKFLTDYDSDRLLDMCIKAYSRFDGQYAPVVKTESGLYFLELWHGPTCAFKDMALQLTPRLLSEALKITGEKRCANILVATSGDTGKAALDGFCNVDQTKILVFYPVNGVSPLQKRQMITQEGNNVEVCAINGNFDDAQSAVKTVFSDKSFAESIADTSFFSSANSINWGRLVPQIAYYVSAYCDMINTKDISLGDEINVCVPTGNFGDIFAAYIAKVMGLPLKTLVCASNDNKILTDFFNTGVYNKKRDFYQTTSPSMDILISSNLERMLYLVCGSEKTAEYMEKLKAEGEYTVNADELKELQRVYYGAFCTEKQGAEILRDLFDNDKYLCDTHTSVAAHCARQYIASTKDTVPMLVVSTASPYKFVNSVCKALGLTPSEDEFESVKLLNKYTKVRIPDGLARLKDKQIRFNGCIEKDQINNKVRDFVSR